jgi:hypothetical protein
MPGDKNDFDEELEIAAIREMRKHDDHAKMQGIVVVVFLLTVLLTSVVMLDF